MTSLPFIRWYSRDFRSDTEHLDARSTGAYALLLMVAWELPECRLPNDDRRLCKWARVTRRVWGQIKSEVMAFWELEDGYWTQKRLLAEQKVARKRISTAQKNGALGGRRKDGNIRKFNEKKNPEGSSRVSETEATGKLSISIKKERGFSFNGGKSLTAGASGVRDTSESVEDYIKRMVEKGYVPTKLAARE